jgi:putative ABC transport system permease protein
VGLFIVHGAVGLAFEQRRATVRTLRALGMPLRLLVLLMALELALLALVAGVLGLALGYLIAAALLPGVAGTLRGLYGAEVAGTLTFRPLWALSGLAIAMGGTAVAAASALHRLATLPLLAGGTRRAGARWAAARARRQGLAGLALLLAALGIGLWGGGLVGGFACLGALMIGGALLLPLLLDRVLALGSRLASARSPNGSGPTPGPSFRACPSPSWPSSSPWPPTSASPPWSAPSARPLPTSSTSASRPSSTSAPDSPAQAESLLAALPPDARVLPIAQVDRPLAGQPGVVQIMRDDPTYPENWTFLASVPDPWEAFHAGQGVLVNEQLARRADLSVGDGLAVTDTLTLPILAIHGDYGNPWARRS